MSTRWDVAWWTALTMCRRPSAVRPRVQAISKQPVAVWGRAVGLRERATAIAPPVGAARLPAGTPRDGAHGGCGRDVRAGRQHPAAAGEIGRASWRERV